MLCSQLFARLPFCYSESLVQLTDSSSVSLHLSSLLSVLRTSLELQGD